MSNLSIYIVEDEFLFLNKLKMLVDKLGYELIGSTDNSDTAFVQIQQKPPDLILADIGINGTMDGIELVNQLKSKVTIPVIFITSFNDNETFDRSKILQPYAYITKPFDEEALARSIELALLSIDGKEDGKMDTDVIAGEEAFFVRSGRKLEKIKIEEIDCLEVESNYTSIHLASGKKQVVKMSLGQLSQRLPNEQFIRIHRGYVVNLSSITSIDPTDMLVYIDKLHYPIGRAYKEELMSRFNLL